MKYVTKAYQKKKQIKMTRASGTHYFCSKGLLPSGSQWSFLIGTLWG